jgi:hypothetical protein
MDTNATVNFFWNRVSHEEVFRYFFLNENCYHSHYLLIVIVY